MYLLHLYRGQEQLLDSLNLLPIPGEWYLQARSTNGKWSLEQDTTGARWWYHCLLYETFQWNKQEHDSISAGKSPILLDS